MGDRQTSRENGKIRPGKILQKEPLKDRRLRGNYGQARNTAME
jgi:hypothetical protein